MLHLAGNWNSVFITHGSRMIYTLYFVLRSTMRDSFDISTLHSNDPIKNWLSWYYIMPGNNFQAFPHIQLQKIDPWIHAGCTDLFPVPVNFNMQNNLAGNINNPYFPYKLSRFYKNIIGYRNRRNFQIVNFYWGRLCLMIDNIKSIIGLNICFLTYFCVDGRNWQIKLPTELICC